jgi:hypothetical protein
MNLKNLIPGFRNYHAAMSRVSALEMAYSIMLRNPIYEAATGAAFNGQTGRQKIFLDLIAAISFQAIYETGTFTGDSTGYMKTNFAGFVFTCEANRVFQSLAISRLRQIQGIEFYLGDSRAFLKEYLPKRETKAATKTFYYLDAHWHEDLPLAEEIAIIAKYDKECVIMIDDFAVPGDAGYTYDNYGRGKSLDIQTFGSCFSEGGMTAFFPSLPSSQETGGKRGSVILARGETCKDVLRKLPSLRENPN